MISSRLPPALGVAVALSAIAFESAADTAPAEPEDVIVVGTPASHTAGSAHVLKRDQLERFEYDDPAAPLLQVPGVYSRGEDGIGLRPNLGIRGANPDRSKKLTLMEDGVLFGPAPYSAPAAYYFPLMTRMTQVRVVKGPAAVAYGPQTVGGAIDLVSRPIPTHPTAAAVDLAMGEYGYGKVHAWAGGNVDRLGFLVEGVRLANTGFTELPGGADTGSARSDWMVKAAYDVDPDARTKHRLQLKLSYADETSNETYLGQTDADFRRDPYRRYAASALDQMKNHRTGVIATHTLVGPESSYRIKTDVYRFDYQRAWNKLNRLGGASASAALANADDSAFAVYHAVLTGRADTSSAADTLFIGPNDRGFVSQGVQSVLSTSGYVGPFKHKAEAGVRLHHDRIRRLHTESAYLMRSGELVPAGQPVLTTANNSASSHALAVHLVHTVAWNGLTVTPGARVEIVASRTEDHAKRAEAAGLVAAVMPGVGAFYELTRQLGVLGGVHRGFGPPAPGSGARARPEYSVNYELGARYTRRSTRAEVIGFFNDYSNLTDVCTLASGCVTTNLDRQFDAGRARIAGLEVFAAHEQPVGPIRLPATLAYTLTYGEFLGDFVSTDPIYGAVRRGDELPYLPRHQLVATLAAEHGRAGVNGSAGYVAPMREQAGSQPIDQAIATDEQVWLDLGAYANVLRWMKLYANVRNVTGAAYVIGRRPYGARPNAPRWFQVGVKVEL